MEVDQLAALTGFAAVSSLSPGPNNLMLMASGANFGVRRTLPHMLGIAAGFMLMLTIVGLGLAEFLEANPTIDTTLQIVSIGYLLYLAKKIATAAPVEGAETRGRPFTFIQAALFQWVNPKAWAMALTAVTVYAPDRKVATVLLVVAIFGAVNLPSVSCWAMFGSRVQPLLRNPVRLRIFNVTMASLLIGTIALAAVL